MIQQIPCELVTWDEFYQLCRRLAQKLRDADLNIDLLIAIGRGGYLPARILSDLLGNMNLTGFKIEHYKGPHKDKEATVRYPLSAPVDGKRILIVDDVSDSGDTFEVAIKHVNSLGQPAAIHTAALHHKTVSQFEPDFYAQQVSQWRWITYPWALIEDVSTFIAVMQPSALEAIADRLYEAHGIHIAQQTIDDALTLLNDTNGVKG